MTNIGTAPCLDQVHVYIDTGYFTTTLRTAAVSPLVAEAAAEEELQRLQINPVTQVNSSELLVDPSNPHFLGTTWNNTYDNPLTFGLELEIPAMVSCATISPVEPTVEGRPLSPDSYQNGMPAARRARTRGTSFSPIQDQPEGCATENPFYEEEADVNVTDTKINISNPII